MALTLSQDDFLSLGRQLTDMAVAAYTQALADHAVTIDVAAPTAHPLIETIVRQHGGRYAVAPPVAIDRAGDLGAQLAALQSALVAKGVIGNADVTVAAAMLAAGAGEPATVTE